MIQTPVTTITIALADAAATHRLGVCLGQQVTAGTVLLLEGNLGAGKTTFVQGLAEGLGIEAEVVSPTFILLSEYPEGRVPLYHFDLYRLENETSIATLGVEQYWDGSEVEPGVVAIEWSERLPYKPSQYWRLSLTFIEDEQTSDPKDKVMSQCQGGRSLRWEAVGEAAIVAMATIMATIELPMSE